MIILDPEIVGRNKIFFSKDLSGGLQIGVFSEKYFFFSKMLSSNWC